MSCPLLGEKWFGGHQVGGSISKSRAVIFLLIPQPQHAIKSHFCFSSYHMVSANTEPGQNPGRVHAKVDLFRASVYLALLLHPVSSFAKCQLAAV